MLLFGETQVKISTVFSPTRIYHPIHISSNLIACFSVAEFNISQIIYHSDFHRLYGQVRVKKTYLNAYINYTEVSLQ